MLAFKLHLNSELPRKKHMAFRTRRKFEIKNISDLINKDEMYTDMEGISLSNCYWCGDDTVLQQAALLRFRCNHPFLQGIVSNSKPVATIYCLVVFYKYRVIKKSLYTWWLQYVKLQVMFRVFPTVLGHLLTCWIVFSKTMFSLALTPSVIPNFNYFIVVNDWNCSKYFCVFFVL
jgi:hypothetical protein